MRKLDSDYRKRIVALEGLIGASIQHPRLYLKALRHRSIVAEKKLAATESYEQLEFLGDAVLDLIASEIIFKKYPSNDEGFMTKLRSRLVKGEMLAELARNIRLMEYIELGDRVKNQGVEYTESVLADTFEALIGAIYLDLGYQTAHDFVVRLYQKYIVFDQLISTQDNFKSILLESAQARKLPAPVYNIIRETGPGHDKVFYVEVLVDNTVLATGKGKNKKKAEQAAAKAALRVLNDM
ncbi:MAG: ribonuclease III [Balneolales bacterium]